MDNTTHTTPDAPIVAPTGATAVVEATPQTSRRRFNRPEAVSVPQPERSTDKAATFTVTACLLPARSSVTTNKTGSKSTVLLVAKVVVNFGRGLTAAFDGTLWSRTAKTSNGMMQILHAKDQKGRTDVGTSSKYAGIALNEDAAALLRSAVNAYLRSWPYLENAKTEAQDRLLRDDDPIIDTEDNGPDPLAPVLIGLDKKPVIRNGKPLSPKA